MLIKPNYALRFSAFLFLSLSSHNMLKLIYGHCVTLEQ